MLKNYAHLWSWLNFTQLKAGFRHAQPLFIGKAADCSKVPAVRKRREKLICNRSTWRHFYNRSICKVTQIRNRSTFNNRLTTIRFHRDHKKSWTRLEVFKYQSGNQFGYFDRHFQSSLFDFSQYIFLQSTGTTWRWLPQSRNHQRRWFLLLNRIWDYLWLRIFHIWVGNPFCSCLELPYSRWNWVSTSKSIEAYDLF